MTAGESVAEYLRSFFGWVDSFDGPMALFCNVCSLWAIWILFCVIKDEYYKDKFDLDKLKNWEE
tara:strand:- start:1125 stop:1316 length:192 start_codon:yes stop_codon:yes gene_type:complete